MQSKNVVQRHKGKSDASSQANKMNIAQQPNRPTETSSLASLDRKTRFRSSHLLALQALLVNGESILQELLLLLQVDGLETGGDGRGRSAASVQDVTAVVMLGGVEKRLKAGLSVRPGTRVQRLLLAPDDVLGVGVAVQVVLQLSPREGVQLFHPSDGGVADALSLAVLDKGSVDLARTDDDTLDLLGCVDGRAVGGVGDDPPEVRVTGERLDIIASNRVTQQRLGEEDHQSCRES